MSGLKGLREASLDSIDFICSMVRTIEQCNGIISESESEFAKKEDALTGTITSLETKIEGLEEAIRNLNSEIKDLNRKEPQIGVDKMPHTRIR